MPPSVEEKMGRKIRESCNNCSAQKIRCEKTRPSCQRCTAKGLHCNYSVSLRTGRHPRTASTSASSNKVSPRRKAAMVPDFEMAECFTDSPESVSSLGKLDDVGNGNHMWPEDSIFDLNMSAEPMQAWDPSGFIDFSAWTTSPTQQIGKPSPSNEEFLSTFSSAEKTIPPDNTISFPDLIPNVHPAPVEDACQQTCLSTLLQLTLDLHVPNSACVYVGDPMRDPKEARDIDTVLFQNREALRKLSKILGCSCLAEPSVMFAAYLLTLKIVGLYGSILGCTSALSDGAPTEIVQLPIFIGSWPLDRDAERSVRARVVLNELRAYVQPLVEKLPRFHTVGSSQPSLVMDGNGMLPSPTISASSSSCIDSNAGDVPTCILREQLRRIQSEATIW